MSATLSQLSGKGELPYECGGASCLLNVGRVVSSMGRVVFSIWGELSWGEFSLGRVVFGASCP